MASELFRLMGYRNDKKQDVIGFRTFQWHKPVVGARFNRCPVGSVGLTARAS